MDESPARKYLKFKDLYLCERRACFNDRGLSQSRRAELFQELMAVLETWGLVHIANDTYMNACDYESPFEAAQLAMETLVELIGEGKLSFRQDGFLE